MRFCLYGRVGMAGVKHADLLKLAATGELLARVENSGCEGYYVEVARWNVKDKAWQRYAFEKFLGGEIEELSDRECAVKVADEINTAARNEDASFIHDLPVWGGNG